MKTRHISNTLCSPCCLIMSSDEDQPIVMDMYVGFNVNEQLVIAVDLHDYDEPEYNCSTAAVVNRWDARAMARRNRMEPSRLPMFIANRMAEWDDVINPNFSQVKDCFKEITEFLLDEGCRLKIIRTHGKGAHTCF